MNLIRCYHREAAKETTQITGHRPVNWSRWESVASAAAIAGLHKCKTIKVLIHGVHHKSCFNKAVSSKWRMNRLGNSFPHFLSVAWDMVSHFLSVLLGISYGQWFLWPISSWGHLPWWCPQEHNDTQCLISCPHPSDLRVCLDAPAQSEASKAIVNHTTQPQSVKTVWAGTELHCVKHRYMGQLYCSR